jgi:hypothetical protein
MAPRKAPEPGASRRRSRPRPKLEPAAVVGGGDRPQRAAFAARYPRDERLEAILDAFDVGNFALVRKEALRLEQETDDEDVRDAARDLRRRIEPEPTAIYLWALGVALLIILFAYYLQQGQ